MKDDINTLTKNIDAPDEISLKDVILKFNVFLRYLLSKWMLIFAFSIIGGIVGLAYAYFKKPVYVAQLSFALQDEKSGGLGGAAGLASQFGIDLGNNSSGSAFSGDNLIELMKSRLMVEQTLLSGVDVKGKKETLAELYIDFNNLRDKWKDKPELVNIHFLPGANRSNFTLEQDSILGVFHKELIKSNLSVDKLDKKLSIISLTVTSKNELFSKYFTEILAKVVSDFYIQTRTSKSAKNVAILQRQVDSIRISLNSAIAGVASSNDEAPNANPLRSALRVPSQHKQVDVTANSAILSELVKNLELAKMSLLQETPLIQVIDKPILPLEKNKTSKLMSMLTGFFLAAFIIIAGLMLKKTLSTILS